MTGYFPGSTVGKFGRFQQHKSHNGAAPFSAKAANKGGKTANAAAVECKPSVQEPCGTWQNPAEPRHPPPTPPNSALRVQLSAMLSSPGTKAASGNTAPEQTAPVRSAYLGDGLLVPHDSLLDECVDLNVPVPARHHHPGPAETHRDFHGWSVPDSSLLASG